MLSVEEIWARTGGRGGVVRCGGDVLFWSACL